MSGLGIDYVTSDLEDVVSGPHVGDVHPLAVDVVAVRIPAAYADALNRPCYSRRRWSGLCEDETLLNELIVNSLSVKQKTSSLCSYSAGFATSEISIFIPYFIWI